MKNYTLAALVSSLLGWIIATIIYGIGYFLLDKNQALVAIKIIGPITLIISLLANIVFLQAPRSFIKQLFLTNSRLVFGLAYAVIAFFTLKLAFGGAFGGYNPIEQLATFNPIINGFSLGFLFRSIWIPNQTASKVSLTDIVKKEK
ncbi:hypothetical protein [Hymenobacter negativus]|uniref:Uncharacterized protein n=1 Tax=Hymenobacter negativus TaxID=2795026 RepID=A0ABS3QCQ6_9BACT|nr:hypothetical protein [Hymenobacter negativus]MBO2009019.1 hypothetical protein [Hymenobacter negativus]